MKSLQFLLLLIVLFNCSNDESLDIIGTTEAFTIESNIIQDAYQIYVFLPENYSTDLLNQLVIGLDGDTRFNSIASIISDKVQNGTIPPTVFVAIGNNKERNRDYTPTTYDEGSGGASNFYQFIKDELIPELESRYSIDTSYNKTLIGHSFGGLFTQYVMAQDRETNPFDKFIASGTSYWYDSGVIFENEQTYADNHTDLNATFYNGMGTLEGGVMLASFDEMNERLDNRDYQSFRHNSELIEESGHSGSADKIFKKGLDYVFSNN